MQRILVIQLKRIGDFILTMPAIHALRLARPKAEIVMLAPAIMAGFASCIPDVDRVISFKSGQPNLNLWMSAIAGEWDACLDFTGTARAAWIVKLSHAKRRIGYAKFADKGIRRHAYNEFCDASVRDLHTIQFHLAMVEEYVGSASLNTAATKLRVSGKVKATAEYKFNEAGLKGRFAILHPGTTREDKFWIDERWSLIAAHLHEQKGLTVVLTGSGDSLEKGHIERIKSRMHTPVIDLSGKLSLVEFATLVESCELIVGVDSMAMHMAALFSKPQIALFGPTNPFHWRPMHDKAVVLQGDEGAPVEHFLPKSTGSEMKLISTDAVIGAIESLCI